MYNCIQSKNLIYFIKEAEFKRKYKNLNCEEKLNEFSVAISCVGNSITDAFYQKTI